MSFSAVSPCTSPHAAQLPDQFTINFSRDELVIALRWCERFAPADGGDNVAVVTLGPKKRTWTFVEDNVMGYYVNGESSPCEGVIPVTHTLLALATDATQEDSVNIDFDVLHGAYRLHLGKTVVELPMPMEWDVDSRFRLTNPTTVLASPVDVVAMGRSFIDPQLYRSTSNDTHEYPFITCEVENGVMTFRRSWEKWGGQKMAASIPVNGVYSGTFAFEPEAVVREMYYVDTYCEGSVSIEIATTENPVVTFRGSRCGFSFIATKQYVHEVRQSIMNELVDVSCDLEVLTGNEWEETVHVVSQNLPVDITIVPDDNDAADYLRVANCIAESIPWSLEFAEEINAWNKAMTNTKLVRIDSGVHVIADVTYSNLAQLPAVIDDVVAQSKKVKDFIAIFQ